MRISISHRTLHQYVFRSHPAVYTDELTELTRLDSLDSQCFYTCPGSKYVSQPLPTLLKQLLSPPPYR